VPPAIATIRHTNVATVIVAELLPHGRDGSRQHKRKRQRRQQHLLH